MAGKSYTATSKSTSRRALIFFIIFTPIFAIFNLYMVLSSYKASNKPEEAIVAQQQQQNQAQQEANAQEQTIESPESQDGQATVEANQQQVEAPATQDNQATPEATTAVEAQVATGVPTTGIYIVVSQGSSWYGIKDNRGVFIKQGVVEANAPVHLDGLANVAAIRLGLAINAQVYVNGVALDFAKSNTAVTIKVSNQ